MTGWRERPLADLLAEHGLTGLREDPFPTDGWSGSTFTTIDAHGRRFVLKRVSADRDWIVRATADTQLREAWVAGRGWSGSYLGAAVDDDGAAVILMPDLSASLLAWGADAGGPGLDAAGLDHLLERMAALHGGSWSDGVDGPWCPLPERLTLLTPPAADRYAAEGNRVGPIFQAGWAAFRRHADPAAVALVDGLSADVGPLVAALATLPAVGLHGDLKLANITLADDGSVDYIDWQMTLRAPIAVELGWFAVTNSGELPVPAEAVLASYPGLADADVQRDLAAIVGLLLRGWRKGRDTESDAVLASGVSAADDLAWWCRAAVDAAERRL